MSLPTISIKRPIFTIVVNLLILLFGFMGFKKLGIREFPVIDPPAISVRTDYAGASAEVIESQITYPLEKALNGIEGVKSISSSSNLGSSNITVEFDLGIDMETAANDVRDKVSQAQRTLPRDLDGPPVVSKYNGNSEYIIAMTIVNKKLTDLEICDYADNVLIPRLQTIPGVSMVQLFGEKKFAMRLWLDPVKMAAYKVTLQDVKQAFDKENIELPAGKLEGNHTELTVKANAKFKDAHGFDNMIIRASEEKVVRLQDIGYAQLGAENEQSSYRIDALPSVSCTIIPQPGANHVDIAKEFYKRYEALKKELPPDFQLSISNDLTRFVTKSITEVTETLVIAVLLVVLIIYLFFRDWSVALRPLIDIPVSLVGTFFIMYLFGFSLNVLTLLAIVLATGLVVDDGIVVTENIYKKMEQGLSPFQAAIQGANEIVFAVISTSITLVAIFLPIIFMEGFVGKLFVEFGIVVASSIIISIFVSLTLTPMLNAWLVKDVKKKTRFYERTEPFFIALTETYHRSLKNFMQNRWLAFVIIGTAILLTIFTWQLLPKELAPLEDRSMLRVSFSTPEGASFEYTDDFMVRFTNVLIDSIPEKSLILSVTGGGFSSSSGVNSGMYRIPLVEPEKRTRSQQEIADQIARISKKFPEAKLQITQEQTISTGSRGLPIQYVIQAADFEKLREVLPKFIEEAQKDPAFSVVDVNLKFNRPEIQVLIDRERARSMQVNVLDVAQSLQLALSGQRFGFFNMNGKQYQVIGQFDRVNRNELLDLKNIYVRSSTGILLPLDNLVEFKEESSPPQLFRYNRYAAATISAGLAPGTTIGEGLKVMDNIASNVFWMIPSQQIFRALHVILKKVIPIPPSFLF